MSELLKSSAKIVEKNNTRYESPKAILLDRKQWLYVQNRHNLTPRERQVAELICQGFRNGSIAEHLRIKPGTVKTHIRNIYRKVQVQSKIAMLLRFVTEAKTFSNRYDEAPRICIAD